MWPKTALQLNFGTFIEITHALQKEYSKILKIQKDIDILRINTLNYDNSFESVGTLTSRTQR